MRQQVEKVERKHVTESEPQKFITEASDLGLPVGTWPLQLNTDLGNGQPFIRRFKKADREGDIMYVRYMQANGCCNLIVFND